MESTAWASMLAARDGRQHDNTDVNGLDPTGLDQWVMDNWAASRDYTTVKIAHKIKHRGSLCSE